MRDPGHLPGQEYPFRVRHHDGKTPVGAGEPGHSLHRPVRVVRVGFRHIPTVVDKAHRYGTRLSASVHCCLSLPVGHYDRESRSGHTLEKQGGRVSDLHHHHPGFELLGSVAGKIRPAGGAGYDAAQPGQHLAAVADAQAETVGAVEKALELVPEALVMEDGLRPAAARAEHVAVGKSAAGDQAG